MAEAPVTERRRRREEAEQPGYIIKVDSRAAEENLFRLLAYQADSKYAIKTPEVEEIKRVPSKVSAYIHELTRHYFNTILGGQIISPYMGRDIVLDRAIPFTEVLLSMLHERIQNLSKEIESKKLRGEDFEKEIRELLEYPEIAFITVRELLNRLLTAVHINAPPHLRPPLVNVKLGYDKVE